MKTETEIPSKYGDLNFIINNTLSSSILPFILVTVVTIGFYLWNPVLFILVIAFAVPCLIALSNFTRGFYVYLFILPFAYFLKRLLFLFPEVTQIEWFVATALPDLVLISALCNLILCKDHRMPKSASLVPVSLFLLWCILEIFNPNISVVIGISGFKKTAFYIIIYYLVIAVANRDNKVVDKIANITIVCSIIVTVYEFIQIYYGFFSFEISMINSGLTNLTVDSIDVLFPEGVLRPFSTFSGPWVMGDYLVIGFMFNLFKYLKGKVNFWKFILISFWIGLGIFFSLSRTSYLMLIISLLFFYTFKRGSKRSLVHKLVIISLGISLIVFAVIYMSENSSEGLGTAIFSLSSLFSRMELWDSILDVSTFTVVGLGIGSSQASFYFGKSIVAESHSFLLTLIFEIGFIGVGLFLRILYIIIRDVLVRMKSTVFYIDHLTLNLLLSISIAMVITKSMGGGLWGQHMHDNYLWIFFGILSSLSMNGSLKARVMFEKLN